MNYLQDVIHKISVNYRQIPRKFIDAEIDGKDCFCPVKTEHGNFYKSRTRRTLINQS